MIIRRESVDDIEASRDVTQCAFGMPDGPEVAAEARLVDQLRADQSWIPALSLVALLDGAVVGHAVCTRGQVGHTPALGLGPLSVHPDHQNRGIGSSLVHTVLGAADALDEAVVILLGNPRYYRRFGLQPAAGLGISLLGPWGEDFQARTLSAYAPTLRGRFRFANPFAAL